ncbi:uncharacterized protein LOC132947133 [Metopolophium dirhodum]|uniref:uncharacterized protein LOC132947133 n=1 Tax=Metopolophium dirhodum TaxID=44670 RepID=UPI00298F7DA1|nr:uncharacterized protein LOC132947133 [Metopolophium dirhodum]XP_060873316.1 uncharacterized protein LOC132947133 [Metopolophium dirhodum]XP_060873317.1 uncharacterized protein LOC132947133 [Metopolophium dirhodum]XP_060873318.1 uncharacterized protein LOC132947133 [Metopolophium dirhodum]
MVKHIIIKLTLCFMVYIIGNIDAAGEEARKAKFLLAVQCNKQLFENGLIKGIPDLQRSPNSTFKVVLTQFYTSYGINTITATNREILPTIHNSQFTTDEGVDSFIREFVFDFLQNGTNDIFQGKITALKAKVSNGQLNDYPLKTFVNGYNPGSHKEYLKTTTGFCIKYSQYPNFRGPGC